MRLTLCRHLLVLFVLLISYNTYAQVSKDSELFKTMAHMDSIIFNEGYNNCNITLMEKAIHEDFEMYHDKAGIISGKEKMVSGIRDGICNGLSYKATRKLQEGSLEVFPLKNNGALYGVLQTGTHEFYAKYPDKDEILLTSTARFNHLWILDNGNWKLKQSLSFDHIATGH